MELNTKKLEIRFRNNEPTVINPKCAQCSSDCTQHIGLKIIYCPYFKATRESKNKQECILQRAKVAIRSD